MSLLWAAVSILPSAARGRDARIVMATEIVTRVRRVSPKVWVVIGAVVLALVLWFVFRPSLADLEKTAAEKTGDRKTAEKGAETQLGAEKAALERIESAHLQDRSVQEARISDLEARAARQASELRAQASRTAALLAERTQARTADIGRVATASEPELHARAAALVGDLVAPEGTYRRVIKLGVDLDQARDELAAARETIAAGGKEAALRQELTESLKARLDDEKRHSEQLADMATKQQESFSASLAELKARTDAEAEANAKVIKRLKGNSFFNAVKTGAKVGAGIGIGIAIGKVMH
jgi:hypothetical protein